MDDVVAKDAKEKEHGDGSVEKQGEPGDQGVELEVVDDGRGFDTGAVGEKGGMGLISMRERAEKLGGTLQVISAPGKGTRVSVRLATRGDAPIPDETRPHDSEVF